MRGYSTATRTRKIRFFKHGSPFLKADVEEAFRSLSFMLESNSASCPISASTLLLWSPRFDRHGSCRLLLTFPYGAQRNTQLAGVKVVPESRSRLSQLQNRLNESKAEILLVQQDFGTVKSPKCPSIVVVPYRHHHHVL